MFFMKISEAFKLYICDYVLRAGKSINTESSYLNISKSLISFFGDVDIESLSFSDFRDWHNFVSSRWRSNTVRNAISCIRMVLKMAARRGFNVMDYEELVVPKREKYVIQYLLPEEIEDFISVASRQCRGYGSMNRLRNIAILRLLAASGIRVSELVSLNRNSIRHRKFTVVGKSKNPRVVFIDEATEDAINNYLACRTDDNSALFISHQGARSRLTTGGVRRIFEFVCANSHFTDVTPHTIRHSFATTLLDRGVELCYISDLLGHQSLDTTRIYTHYTNTKLQHIYDSVMT